MPTYDYRCPDGHTFERRAKMSEAASELECPVCGKMATRQLSGGAGLVFKGSGFYLTDYGKNAHRGGAPESAGSARKDRENGESKSADTPGDSKPSEAKAVEAKSSDTKSADTKSSDSKPAASKSSDTSGSAAGTSTSSPSKKSDQ
jgi:putative FmdB family regulatory protein